MSKLTAENKRGVPDQYRAALSYELELSAIKARQYIRAGGIMQQDGYENVDVEEMHNLGRRLLQQPSTMAMYSLLATSPSRSPDTTWYDITIGAQHTPQRNGLRDELSYLLKPKSVRNGLDLGAGTGESTRVIIPFCQNIVVADLNQPMLEVAKKRLEKEIKDFQAVVMDATAFALPRRSFQLVTSHGIEPYLSETELSSFFRMIYETLDYGGFYCTYSLNPNSIAGVYKTSPRAELAGNIVSIVLSSTFQPSRVKSSYQIAINPAEYHMRRLGYTEISSQFSIYQKLS